METPFPQSFWVHEGFLCAGCYPGDLVPAERDRKLRGLLDCGLRRVVNLMEEDEKSGGRAFEPYMPLFHALAAERGITVECLRLPIRDASVPTPSVMRQILDTLDESLSNRIPTYVHCWGGHGRTSGGRVSPYTTREDGRTGVRADRTLAFCVTEVPRSL